jgi:hypothetical protein
MKRTMTLAFLSLALPGLHSCSSGSPDAGMAVGGSAPPTAVDGFTQNVQVIANTQSDISNPVSLDGFVAVAADQAAPVVVY